MVDKDILIVTTIEDLEELPSISLAAGNIGLVAKMSS